MGRTVCLDQETSTDKSRLDQGNDQERAFTNLGTVPRDNVEHCWPLLGTVALSCKVVFLDCVFFDMTTSLVRALRSPSS